MLTEDINPGLDFVILVLSIVVCLSKDIKIMNNRIIITS